MNCPPKDTSSHRTNHNMMYASHQGCGYLLVFFPVILRDVESYMKEKNVKLSSHLTPTFPIASSQHSHRGFNSVGNSCPEKWISEDTLRERCRMYNIYDSYGSLVFINIRDCRVSVRPTPLE